MCLSICAEYYLLSGKVSVFGAPPETRKDAAPEHTLHHVLQWVVFVKTAKDNLLHIFCLELTCCCFDPVPWLFVIVMKKEVIG